MEGPSLVHKQLKLFPCFPAQDVLLGYNFLIDVCNEHWWQMSHYFVSFVLGLFVKRPASQIMRVKNHKTRPRVVLSKRTMGTCPSVKSDVSRTNLVTLQLGIIMPAGKAWSEKIGHGRANSTMHHYFALHSTKDHQASCHSSLTLCNVILSISDLQIYLKLNKHFILDPFATN